MLQRTCDCGEHTGGGECEDCKKKKKMPLQRRADGLAAPAIAPPIVHDVLRSPGQPLDEDTQSQFAAKFRRDFSQVRVHTDEQAAESARAVGALAYTVGNNVVFGAGRYSPANSGGRRLLAHELTHVVQQRHESVPSPQYRLEIGPSQDRYEREADELADRMASGMEASHDEDLALPTSHATARVQRAAATGTDAGAGSTRTATPLLVEDDAHDLQSGQMRKGEFLDKLQVSVCAAADEVLLSVGRTAQACPYLARWIGHLRSKESHLVERGVRKYAPESAGVTKAHDYIPLVTARVRRGVTRWTRTGEITEVPEELRGQLFAANVVGAVEKLISGIGGAIGRAASAVAGGVKKAVSAIGSVFAKERDGGVRDVGSPQEIQAQLGEGRPLDGSVKARMESAVGGSFAKVRVHDDSSASELSARLNTRAFTIGSDVAFGAGEYRPGTPVGDALIAHELAHVIQQRNEGVAAAPLTKGGGDYNALEEEADASAVGAVFSLWSGRQDKPAKPGKDASTRLRSGLRLQRCGGEPDKVNLTTMSQKQRQQFAKTFVQKNFSAKDQSTASKILDDMLQSHELSFKDEDALRTEIFKRMETTKFMQQSQGLFGVAFEYPNKPAAKACIPNNKAGRINPRVNKAAEPYWGPVEDSQGEYHFNLSEAGKQNAYKALTTLFTPQKSICDMTLIHCDYLASMVHFRAFAESIGIEEFNKRVKNGDVHMRLAWNGFQELEDTGWFHSKKSVSLREVRPANENDLVIGDHVIFWNHRAYDWLNERIGNAWRLENAILVYRRGKEDHFLGHGSGDNTNQTMREKLALEYNIVIKKAEDITKRAESKNAATASAAKAEIGRLFPNVENDDGQWVIKGGWFSKSYKLRPVKWNDPDLTGLRDPDKPSKMNCAKRPAEAPGESC
jgi:hypothetical protein